MAICNEMKPEEILFEEEINIKHCNWKPLKQVTVDWEINVVSINNKINNTNYSGIPL